LSGIDVPSRTPLDVASDIIPKGFCTRMFVSLDVDGIAKLFERGTPSSSVVTNKFFDPVLGQQKTIAVRPFF
jgi:hypothetical protein